MRKGSGGQGTKGWRNWIPAFAGMTTMGFVGPPIPSRDRKGADPIPNRDRKGAGPIPNRDRKGAGPIPNRDRLAPKDVVGGQGAGNLPNRTSTAGDPDASLPPGGPLR